MDSKYECAWKVVKATRKEFVNIGECYGAAQCLKTQGEVLYMLSKYEDAQTVFMEARKEFVEIEDSLGAAMCTNRLKEMDFKNSCIIQ